MTEPYKPRAGDFLVGPDRQVRLVGHCNELGGVCDDCTDDLAFVDGFLCEGWRLHRNMLDEFQDEMFSGEVK